MNGCGRLTRLMTTLLLGALACGEAPAPPGTEANVEAAPSQPLPPLDSASLAVLGAVVDSFPYYYRADPSRGLRVFIERTTLSPDALSPANADGDNGVPDWIAAVADSAAVLEAIADFERANRSGKAVGEVASRYAPAMFDRPAIREDLPRAERARAARAWVDLLTEMSDSMTVSIAVLEFSAPGFSRDSSVAFVEVDWGCGGLCGDRRQLLLRNEGAGWRVVAKRILAVS